MGVADIMLSIHTNVNAMNTFRYLRDNGKAMSKSIEKLSSGYRINAAEDAPSDLLISEKLRAQIEGLERAIRNTGESKSILGITEGALGEVQNILRGMNGLAISSANRGVLNQDQIAADQAQIDVALQSIERILATTSYAGRKLLDNLNIGAKQGQDSTENATGLQIRPAGATDSRFPGQAGGLHHFVRPEINAVPQVDAGGLLAAGDKTFTVTGKNGATLASLAFAEGTDVAMVVAALKGVSLSADEQAAIPPGYVPPDSRYGPDINAVSMNAGMLAHLQGLSDADAATALASYMNNHGAAPLLSAELGEAAAGFDPLAHLSEEQKKLHELSNKLTGMNMGGLGGVQVTKRYNRDGGEETRTLYLADM